MKPHPWYTDRQKEKKLERLKVILQIFLLILQIFSVLTLLLNCR